MGANQLSLYLFARRGKEVEQAEDFTFTHL